MKNDLKEMKVCKSHVSCHDNVESIRNYGKVTNPTMDFYLILVPVTIDVPVTYPTVNDETLIIVVFHSRFRQTFNKPFRCKHLPDVFIMLNKQTFVKRLLFS